jgi:hypothetical protein
MDEWVQSFRSEHVGTVIFVLADVAVRGISDSIDFSLFQKLSTRGGGEVVGEF